MARTWQSVLVAGKMIISWDLVRGWGTRGKRAGLGSGMHVTRTRGCSLGRLLGTLVRHALFVGFVRIYKLALAADPLEKIGYRQMRERSEHWPSFIIIEHAPPLLVARQNHFRHSDWAIGRACHGKAALLRNSPGLAACWTRPASVLMPN